MNSIYYFIYILASKRNGTLYVGITSNLIKRIWEHKNGIVDGFTKQYKVHSLVYYEQFTDVNEAIAREKYLKGKKREYKHKLIEEKNSEWQDLYNLLIK